MPVTINGSTGLTGVAAIDNVSSTELGYVDGVTSAIQTQIDSKIPSSVIQQLRVSSLTAQTGTPDIVPYTPITLTITAGTWLINGSLSVYNTVINDSACAYLYNTATSSEVTNSRGSVVSTSTTFGSAAHTMPLLVTVTTSTSYRLAAVRNGGSTLATFTGAGGIVGWMTATRLA